MKLSGKARMKLPDNTFALPKQRKYPLNNASHARNALARASQYATPDEKALIKRKVKAKYPGIKVK